MSIEGQIERAETKVRVATKTAAKRALRRPPMHGVLSPTPSVTTEMPSVTPGQKLEVKKWEAEQLGRIEEWGRTTKAEAKAQAQAQQPQVSYEGLTSEEERIIQDYGPEEVIRRRKLAAEQEWHEEVIAGKEKFETENVQLDTGEWVPLEGYEELSSDAQSKLQTLGVGGFNKWVDEQTEEFEEFKATNIEVEPDVWISKDTPSDVVDKIRTIGYEGYVAEIELQESVLDKLEPYKEKYVSKNLFGLITSPIQPLETTYTYDIGKAQVEGAVTAKELEKLDFSPEEIKEAKVRTEVGWKAWIPIYGTAKLWDVAPGWEKALMLGSDVLLFLPMIGGVAKGATAVTRAATVGGRAATVGKSFARMGLEVVKFPFKVVGGVGSAIRHPVQASRLLPSGLKEVALSTVYPIRHPILTTRAWGGLLTGTRALPGPALAEFASIASIRRVKVPIKLGAQLPGDIAVLDDVGRVIGYQRQVWRGLTIGERPIYPKVPKTLGVTPSELAPWIPSTSLETRITMRRLTIPEVKYLRQVGKSIGLTGKEISVIKRTGIPRITSIASREVVKYPAVIPEVKRFIGWKSPYGTRLLKFPTVKGLTAESVATLYDEVAEYAARTGRNVVPFGSGVAGQQMPSGMGRLPADLDIIFYSPKSEVDDWARLTAKKMTNLGYNKVRAKISPTEVNLQAWDDVTGKWIRVTDIKYLPDVETLQYTRPSQAFGITLEEPLVTFKTASGKTLRGWSLAQQAKTKGLGSLVLEQGKVGPGIGRIKDITDFIDYVRVRGDITAAKAISKLYGLSWDEAAAKGLVAPAVRFGPTPLGSTFSPFLPSTGLAVSSLGGIPSQGVSMVSVPSELESLASPLVPVSSLSSIPSLMSLSRSYLKGLYSEVGTLGYDISPLDSKVPYFSKLGPYYSQLGYIPPSSPVYRLPSKTELSSLLGPSISKIPPSGFTFGIPRIPPGSPGYGPPPDITSRIPPHYPSPGGRYPFFPPSDIPPRYPLSYPPPESRYLGLPPLDLVPPVPPVRFPPRRPVREFLPLGLGREERRVSAAPEVLSEWQQGFIKKQILEGYDKPVSTYNPVPKGEGKPGKTFRYVGEGRRIPGDVDLGVVDIAFSEKGIRFTGGGLETDVGKRHPSKTKGMTIRRKGQPVSLRA